MDYGDASRRDAPKKFEETKTKKTTGLKSPMGTSPSTVNRVMIAREA